MGVARSSPFAESDAMVHAAQIAAELPINATDRRRFIRSPCCGTLRPSALAVVRPGGQQSGDSRGQNSTIGLRFRPASSFGGGLCGLGKQPLGRRALRLCVTWNCLWNRAFKIKLTRPYVGLFSVALRGLYVPEFGFATHLRSADLLLFWYASRLAL